MAFLSLSHSLSLSPPSLSLQYGTSHESITPLYASCPTWMQITEGSVGKALLIKTRCLTHYNPLMHMHVAKMNSR